MNDWNLNKYIICSILLVLMVSVSCAQSKQKRFPKSVSEAVCLLEKDLLDKDKEYIALTRKSELSKFHFTLGQKIRNSYGLLGDNKELLASIGSENIHPDDVSRIIIESLWHDLRLRMEDNFRLAVEKTEITIEKISVAPFDYNGVEFFNIVNDLNEKYLNKELVKIEICSDNLKTKPIIYKEEQELPLSLVLARLEFRSGSSMKYLPYKICFGGELEGDRHHLMND